MTAAVIGCEPTCAACEEREATGRSITGLPVCSRCAGDAEYVAREYAVEVEAARLRREAKAMEDRPRVIRALERLEGHTAASSQTPVVSSRGLAIRRIRRGDPAAAANRAKSERQRGVRQAIVVGTLTTAAQPCSVAQLADLTALSRATIKRTIAELALDKRLTVTRAPNASTFYYALKAGK